MPPSCELFSVGYRPSGTSAAAHRSCQTLFLAWSRESGRWPNLPLPCLRVALWKSTYPFHLSSQFSLRTLRVHTLRLLVIPRLSAHAGCPRCWPLASWGLGYRPSGISAARCVCHRSFQTLFLRIALWTRSRRSVPIAIPAAQDAASCVTPCGLFGHEAELPSPTPRWQFALRCQASFLPDPAFRPGAGRLECLSSQICRCLARSTVAVRRPVQPTSCLYEYQILKAIRSFKRVAAPVFLPLQLTRCGSISMALHPS